MSWAKITQQTHCFSPRWSPWPSDPPCFPLCFLPQSFPMDHFHHFMILRYSILSDSIPGSLDHLDLTRNADIQTADHFGFVNSKAISFFVLPIKQKNPTKLNTSLSHLMSFSFWIAYTFAIFHLHDGLWHLGIQSRTLKMAFKGFTALLWQRQ